MPQPSDSEPDIKTLPGGPSVSLQLHQEFAGFRTTILNDMKSLLQAALQEVLDQHEVLIRNQEFTMKEMMDATVRQMQEVSGPPLSPASRKRVELEKPYVDPSELLNQEEHAVANQQISSIDAAAEMEKMSSMNVNQGSSPPVYPFYPEKPAVKEPASIDASSLDIRKRVHSPYVKGGLRPMALPTAHTHASGDIYTRKKLDATAASKHLVLFGRSRLHPVSEIDEETYSVSSLYREDAALARSLNFNAITLLVVFANTVYLGIETDHINATSLDDVQVVFRVSENLFCIFFLVEILIRLASFQSPKQDVLRDIWFKFDAILVIMMIFESWILPLFLLMLGVDSGSLRTGMILMVRILRLARIVRLLRALPEVVTFVQGIRLASRAVLSTLLTLFCLVYVFAIAMHSCLADVDETSVYFATLPDSMLTLLMNGVFLDGAGALARQLVDLREYVPLFIFLFFVLITATMVMTLLVGIFCEVVRQIAQAEKDLSARTQIRETLLLMLQECDSDGVGDIKKEDLLGMISNPDAIAILHDLEVDIPHFLELQDMLYTSTDAVLSIPMIMEMILECRGNRPATMQDIVNGHSFTRWAIQTQLDEQTDALKLQIQSMVGLMNRFQNKNFMYGRSLEGEQSSSQLFGTLQSWITKGN